MLWLFQGAALRSYDFSRRAALAPSEWQMAKPKPIGNIVAELLARRGYGRLQAADAWTSAWQEAAGAALAGQSRAGQVRRGVLEVWVTNSTLVQELSFEKARLLKTLTRLVPEEKIRDLKFRVGPID
jgi:predicted nucleic acid-binding Zn ribbon protein